MIAFVDRGSSLMSPLAGAYDGSLVLASYAIAALAAYAGLMICDRIAAARHARERWSWIVAGSVVMGFGVWTMHFIGMIAFTLPIPVGYDVSVTVASLLPAAVASGCALHVIGVHGHGRLRYVVAGALIGAGIGAMHYTGMAAMRMDAVIRYDPALFVLSIVVAVALGITALYASDFKPTILGAAAERARRPLAAALIGLAITGMHYTAMEATYFLPRADAGMVATGHGASHDWLAVAVAIAAVLLTLVAIAATVVDAKLRSASNTVRVSRQQMAAVIENISDGVLLFDGAGRLVMCNRLFRDTYPTLERHTVPGTPYERLLRAWADLAADPVQRATRLLYIDECVQRFLDGSGGTERGEEEQLADGRWMYVRQDQIRGVGIIGVWTDVTPLKSLQAFYESQAKLDTLTGIPNRRLFDERLALASSRAGRLVASAALLYVDLNGFKQINDRHGHEAGDIVLKEVACRLPSIVRDIDTVARLGGDEFAVILEPPVDQQGTEAVARRLLDAISAPVRFGEHDLVVGASLGIAVAAPGAFDVREILKAADGAMYEAKRAGDGTYRKVVLRASVS